MPRFWKSAVITSRLWSTIAVRLRLTRDLRGWVTELKLRIGNILQGRPYGSPLLILLFGFLLRSVTRSCRNGGLIASGFPAIERPPPTPPTRGRGEINSNRSWGTPPIPRHWASPPAPPFTRCGNLG